MLAKYFVLGKIRNLANFKGPTVNWKVKQKLHSAKKPRGRFGFSFTFESKILVQRGNFVRITDFVSNHKNKNQKTRQRWTIGLEMFEKF